MTSADWNQLQISQAELDSIFEPNTIDELAIALSLVLYRRQKQAKPRLLLTIGSFLFLSVLFWFPIVLIVLRQFGLIANSNLGLIWILLVSTCISILMLAIFSFYLHQLAKKARSIAILLHKAQKYNQLIDSFNLLANLDSLSCSLKESSSQSIVELQSIFNSTRSALLESIKLESFVYRQRHQQLDDAYHPQQLMTNLEDNLAHLSVEETRSTEYQQLLAEAVDLGLSMQQEMRKIWHLRQTDRRKDG